MVDWKKRDTQGRRWQKKNLMSVFEQVLGIIHVYVSLWMCKNLWAVLDQCIFNRFDSQSTKEVFLDLNQDYFKKYNITGTLGRVSGCYVAKVEQNGETAWFGKPAVVISERVYEMEVMEQVERR